MAIAPLSQLMAWCSLRFLSAVESVRLVLLDVVSSLEVALGKNSIRQDDCRVRS